MHGKYLAQCFAQKKTSVNSSYVAITSTMNSKPPASFEKKLLLKLCTDDSCWTLQNVIFWLRMLPVEHNIPNRTYYVLLCYVNMSASFITHFERCYCSEQHSFLLHGSLMGCDLFKSIQLSERPAFLPPIRNKEMGLGQGETNKQQTGFEKYSTPG